MSRKQKIIVSVTGIFIVLLALVGLTYGYFLTTITDNNSERSIELTTANLELLYQDGNGVLTPAEKLLPGNAVKFKTSTGAVTTEKTFSVTNNGDDTEYVVIFENVEVTNATTGAPTMFESNDFRYTITCTNGTTPCNGRQNDSFPMNGGVIVGNNIAKNEVQTYTLTMEYLETKRNQSNDMNKTISALINITDIKKENPYSSNKSSLAYNIINNSIKGTNGTKLLNVPDTPVASGVARYRKETVYTNTSWWHGTYDELYGNCFLPTDCAAPSSTTCSLDMIGKFISPNIGIIPPTSIITGCDSSGKPIVADYINEYESSLSVANDDYGTSYYYRGNVQDNFVTFANMCWRIIRIVGDGSVKLILEDQDQPCSPSINGNWAIPTTTGGTTYLGHIGYTQYPIGSLTSSDGKTNSSAISIMNYLKGTANTSTTMATAFKNFENTFNATELSKLKSGNWCFGNQAYDNDNNILNSKEEMDNIIKGNSFNYASNLRLNEMNINGFLPTLKCDGTIMNTWEDNETDPSPMYVGTITADEAVFAGGHAYSVNENYYLINNEFKKQNGFLAFFKTLSLNSFRGNDYSSFIISSDGYIDGGLTATLTTALRPSIVLSHNMNIKNGDGTLQSPYEIE